MSFKAVWGFDPEEVLRAQGSARQVPDGAQSHEKESGEAAGVSGCAPEGEVAQIYELRRMFRR